MRSITYVSTSHPDLDVEIAHLAPAARRRNELLGVTGRLLFAGGNIIHTIEGPRQWVGMLFELFTSDPRHWDVLVLLDQPIMERTFLDWTVGFRHRNACDVLAARGAHHTHLSPGRALVPAASPAARLHQVFNENMR